ncbi:MAG: T9SS type A sorting domain-containing protein, partial [Candidatus Delongbacteria bacterium]|nr:T9SS type A sorting domain-containing protein [Candidatus Delongbacteria bacterium]
MKKLMTLILVLLATGIFAAEWYSKENITRPQTASKDTVWYTYPNTSSGWLLPEPMERATLYNVDDFDLEYPVYLHGVDASFADAGFGYTYKIYAKDGVTVLWDSGELMSYDDQVNEAFPPAPILLADDFWLSVTPTMGSYPRQFAPDTGAVPSHSYLSNGAGGWILQQDDIDGAMAYLENFYYVQLEPYVGTDMFPPLARTLTGTEVFQDAQMDLSLTVQDQNAVTSPMAAQYSLDGGTTWVDFNMNVSKTNYVFTGTIPAQSDGTVGIVKFFMEDDQANSAWSENFDLLWSKDTPMFVEDFENASFPPVGWTLNTVGAGWVEGTPLTGGFAHGGAKSASHMDDSGTQDDWLITPLISVPALPSATLSFWEAVYWTQYMNGINEIGVSVDGGTTFDIIWSEDPTFVATLIDGDWYFRSATLAAYAGQDIQIGFHYTGDYGCQWYIDDITVMYDYEAPSISSIVGNEALSPTIGAYLNNDMVLNLEITDMTGVDTVVGHYTFDGGTTVVDIDFAQSKGVTEYWTATIPAQAAVASGTINFDLTDLGGLSDTTMDYNIEFVLDTAPALFKYVTGTDVFIGSDMNLEIAFSDESAISSCNGSYSNDGWVTQYDFAMTPSKINDYTYVGTIPAESVEVLHGEVAFTVGDAEGNFMTSDYYEVRWLDGQIEFFEDFESGYSNWGSNGNWAIVEEGEYTSATHALTESPGGNYPDNHSSFVMWSNIMDWSGYFGGSISFWCKYDLEGGFDYMYFEGTPDNGMTWIRLKTWNGEGVGWHEEFISMDGFAGKDQVSFRFLFQSDEGYNTEGMYIDDIEMKTYNNDIAAPTFNTDPYAPAFYEGTIGDYIGQMETFDVSDVVSVDVIYTVDGGAEQTVAATYSGADNIWDYTIPAQSSGSQVDFWFNAVDGSAGSNSGYSDHYTYIAGQHMFYEKGIVSYYNTTENGDAKAVRITVPGTDATTTYAADLTYLLLRNYADQSGHISDDMTVRIWQDDGTGQPGVEVITPFDVTPEANTLVNTSAMTMIDLRSEALRVYGDFWIGYSSEYGTVYSTQEDTGETGTPAYNRSFDGIYNGDGTWTWGVYAGTNYHLRAVLGEATGIEENNMPLTTSLEQNYPNPFNPTTTINFTIANEAKTSLVVYDVMGRTVAKLVDGNLSKGSHKVSFDASNLVS